MTAEGDWGDFRFKSVQKSDYPIVLDHLREVYCHHEPTLKLSGFTEEMGRDFIAMGKYTLDSNIDRNLSFYAIDRNSGRVAAIVIADEVERTDLFEFPLEFESNQVIRLESQLVQIVRDAMIFQRFPNLNAYAEFLFVSVHPDFQNRGLATEMYRRGLTIFRHLGFKLCMSEFTSPITRKIGDKFGFQELIRLHFLDFKDLEGNDILPNAKSDEFMCVQVLHL